MNIAFVIVIVYLVVMFGASFIASRQMKKKAESGQNFLDANRGLNTAMVAAMIAAGAIGGSSTIGVAQNVFDKGMSGAMYTFAWFCAALWICFVLAKRVRHLKMFTLPELFARCFGPIARILLIVGQLIMMIAIISLQYVAGGAILSSMLPEYFNPTTGAILTAVVFVGMTTLGGMLGAGMTNIVNTAVIYISMIAGAILAVAGVGGWDNLTISLAEKSTETPWFSLIDGLGMATIVGWVITQMSACGASQQNVQIATSAKSDKVARRGLFIGAWFILPCGFIAAIFGLVAAVQFPDIASSQAMPTVAMSLPPVAGGLLLSGLWAADISTGMNLLLASANIITNDIIDVARKDGKKSSIIVTRVCIIAVGIITIFMALQVTSILNTLMTVQCILAGVMLCFVAILYFPGALRKSTGAVVLAVGYITMLVWMFVPAIHAINSIYVEWPVCIVAFLICMAVDKRKVIVPMRDPEELPEEDVDPNYMKGHFAHNAAVEAENSKVA